MLKCNFITWCLCALVAINLLKKQKQFAIGGQVWPIRA